MILDIKVFCKECKNRHRGELGFECRLPNKINPFNGCIEEYNTFALEGRNKNGKCSSFEQKPSNIFKRIFRRKN